MRHYLILTFMFMISTAITQAQSRDTIHAKTKSSRPARDLDLTPEQRSQLKSINQQSKATADSIKNDTTMDAGMRRELQKQLAEGRKSKIMAVLTPEQQKKFDAAKKENRKEKVRRKRGGGKKSKQNISTASFTNTYWKLVKVNNTLIKTPENSREVHVKFSPNDNRLQGNAGCNGLGGNYELSPGNGIKMTVISTKMYCDRMETENLLTAALTAADNYKVTGEKLSLYKGKKLLANFESVYF